ncbi:MAG: helix-turn-helix transcriptional regulator [Erysipelotrichaceae bacterium]|nr:helix-turn-helix transcriptional regulator [Erysipelotrichaceae bacterium]
MDAEKTGKLISALRKEKNMTQQQLADKLYVSDKAVSRWETGRGFPEITVLEDIANLLDVSVAEIIKGERIEGTITTNEMESITDDSISISKKYVEQKRRSHILIGFLAGVILLIIAITHLNSPIYFNDPEKIIEIRKMDDQTIVAIMDEQVAGYEIAESIFEESDSRYSFISCYTTRMYEWFGKKEKKLAMLDGEADFIYYYPCEDSDKLIWSDGKNPFDAVVTLPRLVYNYWILLAGLCSLIGIIAYFIFRKRFFARFLLKITFIPVSLLISMLLILSGHFGEIYNAAYYFSGIFLLSIVIYVFLMMLFKQRKKQKNKS